MLNQCIVQVKHTGLQIKFTWLWKSSRLFDDMVSLVDPFVQEFPDYLGILEWWDFYI